MKTRNDLISFIRFKRPRITNETLNELSTASLLLTKRQIEFEDNLKKKTAGDRSELWIEMLTG